MKLSSPETLVAIMDRRGYSLGRLAEEAECSKSFIAHLRVGRKRSCTPELAERISRVLHADRLFLPEVPSTRGHIGNQQLAAGVAA